MGFWITTYRINENLPERLTWRDKDLNNMNDITPGIYKSIGFKRVDCKDTEELRETLEKNEQLEVSDIVEWQLDDEALQHPSKELAEMIKNETNYFIMKNWGLDAIAIEHEKVFVELTLDEIASMIN